MKSNCILMKIARHFWIILLLAGMFMLQDCQNDGTGKVGGEIQLTVSDSTAYKGPAIVFAATEYNFGRVYEGEIVGWYFKYKNLGTDKLLVYNVTASCGCTVPEFSKEPLAPGMEGEIKVVFDTNGRSGNQQKSVNVETNGQPGTTELRITAEVLKK